MGINPEFASRMRATGSRLFVTFSDGADAERYAPPGAVDEADPLAAVSEGAAVPVTTIPGPDNVRRVDNSDVQPGDTTVRLEAFAINFEPVVEGTITDAAGARWQIVAVERDPADITYLLLLRRR